MKEEILNNLEKYSKDKRQLEYEKEILGLLEKKPSLIRYIHPAIIFKNGEKILSMVGDNKRYIKYIPTSVIKKNQTLIFGFCKYNPVLFSYIDKKIQMKNISDVIDIVKKYPLNYDYLDERIKNDSKELFKYCINKLYKVKDSFLVDTYYKYSFENNSLLHDINAVMFNKDLVSILGDSTKRIIKSQKLMKDIENLSNNKYRFKIFIDLLRLYQNGEYIELHINKIIKMVSKDYYFFRKNGNIISLNKDLYVSLFKDSLSINEIKKLYYILSNDLIHVNSREEFYSFTNLRNDYLYDMKTDSIRDIKNTIYEYNYAMSYEEINSLINKYSSSIDYLVSKYKKYKYNIDEIEEYETLLIFREILKISNCNNISKLKDLLEDAYINHKEIKSYDIRINIENRIKRIYHKEYERIINKRIKYSSEEKILYEDLVSKNKQLAYYLGKYVNIKIVDINDFFNILVRKDIDDDNLFKKYDYVSNEYFILDKNEYYLRVGKVANKIVDIDTKSYYLPGKRYNKLIIEDSNILGIICFNEKIDEKVVRRAIELGVPIEIINIKNMSKNINELRNNMLNKILHYIDKDVLYIEDSRIDKYTPIDCIELFFNISNNMVISNSISKDLFTKNIRNIISKIDKINDNYIQISQMLIVLRKSIESIDNTYDKKIVYRDLDKLYRKYNLYNKESNNYEEILLLLDSNKVNDIILFNKYNKNQIEYSDVVDIIDFKKIEEYLKILEDNYYRGDIERIIRISIFSNILAGLIDRELINLCLLTSVFSDIGRLTDVRFGDYSASIFRSIFKNKIKKEDIDIVCAAIDSQDSVEDIEKLKNKYKLKNMDKFMKVSTILKDALYLDDYKYKKDLINKEATRMLKIKDIVINNINNYNIELLIRRNIISSNYYLNLLNMGYKYEDIIEICKK